MSVMSQIDAMMQESPNENDLRREFDMYLKGQLNREDLSDELKEIIDIR